MKILTNFRISRKLLVVTLPLFIILIGLIYFYYSDFAHEEVEYQKQDATLSNSILLQDMITEHQKKGRTMAEIFASNTDVINALKAEDQVLAAEELNAKLQPLVKQVATTNETSRFKLHFHKPGAISFLRVWTDKRFDDLSAFRHTVTEVQTTGKSLEALELGRGGVAVRGIAPIIDNGQVLGSVEVYYSILDISKYLVKTPEKEGIFVLIDKETADKLFFEEEIESKFPLEVSGFYASLPELDWLNPEVFLNPEVVQHSGETNSIGYDSKGTYSVSYIPINDFSGNTIGEIVYVKNHEEIYSRTSAIVTKILVIVISVIVLILVVLLIVLNTSISSPVKKICDLLDKIAEGDLSVDLSEKRKDEIGQLYSAMKTMSGSLQTMVSRIEHTAVNTANGKLDSRADTSGLEGEYRTLMIKFNDALDSVIYPLNVTAEYIDRIAKGNLPSVITEDYKGDFMEVKNNINLCIDSISALIQDANSLSQAATEGRLDVRADEWNHDGDYRKIIEGVNATLDAVIRPTEEAAGCIKKMSRGEMPTPITNEYKGDFNKLKDAINTLISNFDLFIEEIGEMSEKQAIGDIDAFINADAFSGFYHEMAFGVNYAVREQITGTMKILETIKEYSQNNFDHVLEQMPGKRAIANEYLDKLRTDFVNMIDDINRIISNVSKGNLEYRGNVSRHTGTYREIIVGFNETLDALINPINMTSDYLDKLSRGILPPKITEEYQGDFNLSKTGVNKVIDTLNEFITDMKSAVEDKHAGLPVEINESKYLGAFGEMAEGLNNLMTLYSNIMGETIGVISKYADGDFSESLRELPGEQSALSSSINNIRTNLQGFSDDLKVLINAAQDGMLDIRGNAEKYSGGWYELLEGVNSILNAIVEPITEAGNILGIMADGDLTQRMQGNYKGQFEKFKTDINMLADSLHNVISKVRASVGDTADGAQNISSSSETMAAASQEMNSQADDVASAVEEMAKTVTENAQGATETASTAEESSRVATEGRQVVQETVMKMNDIAKVVEESAVSIEKLGESSKAIGDIVRVIDDIADQTNLLALNASIEAARAGEQGRGFAVVADEVRKLAEKTVSATKEIADQITAIQTETSEAVEAMNQGTKEVETGIKLADEAGIALEKVLASSDKVARMIDDIAAASEQQAATTEEISKNVLGISQATGETTHQVEEVANVADQLAQLTVELNSLMDEFNVGNGAISTSAKALTQ